MLDCSNNVRTAYLTVLQNNVIYNGKVIPVYSQIPTITTPDKYIIIGTVNESPDNNNQVFVTNADIDIDIYCEQYRNRDLSVVDSIASTILNLLIPTTGVKDLNVDAQFQIFPIARTASRYLDIENDDLYITRKIITINNLVNQK
jgi:hypothetical protein